MKTLIEGLTNNVTGQTHPFPSDTPQYAQIGRSSNPLAAGTGLSEPKDIKTENYLRYNDNVIDVILRADPLALFVLGNATITSYFKGLTTLTAAVIKK